MLKFMIEDNKISKCITDESEVIIPDNITVLKVYSFKDNSFIKKVICSKSVNIIDNEAFYNCINLEEVIINDGTTIIGKHVFDGCKNLKRLYLPKTIKKLGELFLNNIDSKIEIIYEGSSKELFELIKDRDVCVSHQTQNDFHYYGDDVDKYVPDVWKKSKIIADNVSFVAQCLEDNVVLNSKK